MLLKDFKIKLAIHCLNLSTVYPFWYPPFNRSLFLNMFVFFWFPYPWGWVIEWIVRGLFSSGWSYPDMYGFRELMLGKLPLEHHWGIKAGHVLLEIPCCPHSAWSLFFIGACPKCCGDCSQFAAVSVWILWWWNTHSCHNTLSLFNVKYLHCRNIYSII